MKICVPALSMVLSMALTATSARAEVINGGFEEGTFGDVPGWEGIGDFGAVGPNLDGLGIAPTQGDQLGYMSTIDAFGAVDVSEIEAFLGLPVGIFAGAGINAFNGSAMKQSVDLTAGDTISFDFNFVSFEDFPPVDFNDLAIFATLNDGLGGGEIFLLADVFDTFFGTDDPLAFQTGWITASLLVDDIVDFIPGSYTLGFAVMNVGDAFVGSYLFVDDVQLTPIPEPSTIVSLAIAGMMIIPAAVVRRNRRRSAIVA